MTLAGARVALAASAEFAELDDGWDSLRASLVAAGVEPTVASWDDPAAGWDDIDVVVVAYAWGYVTRRAEFLGWAERVGAHAALANPVAHLRWSSDKTYLADLDAAGVPVVPTAWVPPGTPWDVPSDDYVVKPTVGSGGVGAARYRHAERAMADRHVLDLHAAGHTAMVQPYQRSVDERGETAVVFFGDRPSHAVNKGALLVADAGVAERLWEREVVTPVVAPPAHLEAAQAAMASVVERLGPTVYARVDVVEGDGGRPLVLEVELVEPSLFLRRAPGSADRLVAALERLLA